MTVDEIKIAAAKRYLPWCREVAEKLEKACEAIYGITEKTPIVIVLQPEDTSVKKGTKCSFNVRVLDDTDVTYQWQYLATTEGATWTNSGAASGTTDSLSFNSNIAYNGYKYRCKITKDSNLLISDAVTLTVTN